MYRYDYTIMCEIAGSNALFCDPSTGDCPGSYPAPTPSAIRGILESVAWWPSIRLIPRKVEICTPLRYKNYYTNYGGPLRGAASIKGGNSYQLLASVLIDVCYKIYATALPASQKSIQRMPESARELNAKTIAPCVAYENLFWRRLKRGQFFHTPFLGWKEFTPSYFGPLRSNTFPCKDINLLIPSFLMSVHSDYASRPKYEFAQNVEVKNGELFYPIIKEEGLPINA